MTGLGVLCCALVVTAVLAVLHQRRDGRLRPAPVPGTTEAAEDLRPLLPTAGAKATLVQFSSAFCAPCRATRQVLRDVAGEVAGVEHVEIDAESHLDLVRHLRIVKTPTTLVLDARGREVLRASGQPRKADVLGALAQAVPS